MASSRINYTPSYNQSWALVVGIDEYKHPAFSPLATAVRGARAVAAYFHEQFDFEVTELYNDQATRRVILRWFEQLQPHPDDRIVFYFGGHGITRPLRNRDQGFLALADSEGYWNALAIDDILNEAEAVPSKHVLYLLDACFSGLALGGREADFGVQRTVDYLLTRPASYAITAGGAEVVDDAAAGDYSLFTYYLLEAFEDQSLRADGVLRAKEVGNYLEEHVTAHRRARAKPNHGYLSGSGDGDFLFSWDFGPRLSPDLEYSLRNNIAEVRWGAVAHLINIAKGDDPEQVLIARERLEEIAQADPDSRVRLAARSFFDEEKALQEADAERERQEEARKKLEEARRRQEEAARIAREAEEALRLAQQRAEEERLLAEQAEQERQKALDDALKRRQLTALSQQEEVTVDDDIPNVEEIEKRAMPKWVWGAVGAAIVVVILGVVFWLIPKMQGNGIANVEEQVTSTATKEPSSTTENPEIDVVEEAPTDTVVPTASATYTPIPPTATIDADPSVYDNFDNPAYDGSYNNGQWVSEGEAEGITQQDGVLLLILDDDSFAAINASKYHNFILAEPIYYEADLLFASGDVYGNVSINVLADKADWVWFANCLIAYNPTPSPYNQGNCWDTLWTAQEDGHWYATSWPNVQPNTWHTFRIEIIPDTMMFSYYIDGTLYGQHVPVDAEELRLIPFSFQLNAWAEEVGNIEGKVDNVKIGSLP